jgi:hypothetical protein
MHTEIKPEWAGETAVIFASGPSVTQQDIKLIERARDAERCRVIAINAMYQLVDYADLLYFCDWQFYKWHAIESPQGGFYEYPAPKFTICDKEQLLPAHIHRLKRGDLHGLSRKPDTLNHGSNSAHQCLNLAYLLGSPRIILVGLDMKTAEDGRTHCHDPHKQPTDPKIYDKLVNNFDGIARELNSEGIEVINTSQQSALHCFKKMPLEEVIL